MPEDLENKGMDQRIDSINDHSTPPKWKSKIANITEPSASSANEARKKGKAESLWDGSQLREKQSTCKQCQPGHHINITMNGKKFEEVDSFK